MLTKSALKARGWTDTLIREFVPTPDRTRGNRYNSNAPILLYEQTRVERIESTSEFQDRLRIAKGRSCAAQKATAVKARKLEEHFDGIKIKVPLITDEALIEIACNAYNFTNGGRTDFEFASPSSAPEFLERICVNYIRHMMTNYEHHLGEIAGKVGTREAYWNLKEKVLDAIGEAYPHLFAECFRQMGALHSCR